MSNKPNHQVRFSTQPDAQQDKLMSLLLGKAEKAAQEVEAQEAREAGQLQPRNRQNQTDTPD